LCLLCILGRFRLSNFKFVAMQETNKFAEEVAGKGVDVLINNAGIFGGRESKIQSPLEGELISHISLLVPHQTARCHQVLAALGPPFSTTG
jgi:hypothetical protein